jgi:hypothetical protein
MDMIQKNCPLFAVLDGQLEASRKLLIRVMHLSIFVVTLSYARFC